MIKYRSVNDDSQQEFSDLAGVVCVGPSMTVQSQAEDADLNVIVRRFGITGRLPENARVPTYGDFTGVGDYRSALEAVRAADEAFMEIPADVRLRFSNDPQLFLEFCSDESNLPEMRKLGLCIPEVPSVSVNQGVPVGAGVSPGGVVSPPGGGGGGNSPPSGGGAGAAG